MGMRNSPTTWCGREGQSPQEYLSTHLNSSTRVDLRPGNSFILTCRLLMSSITSTATSCVLWEFMLGTSPGTPQDCPPPTLVGAPGEEPRLKLLESRQECSHCQILCLTTRFY